MGSTTGTMNGEVGKRQGDSIFQDFKDHFSAPSASPENAIFTSLQNRYPDHTVTVVDGAGCDLFQYAGAGQADAKLLIEDCAVNRVRSFAPSARLAEGKEGKHQDKIVFGKYEFKWDQSDFLLYRFYWTEFRAAVKRTAILRSRQDDDLKPDGHSIVIDKLIAAATEYNKQLREEVMVFDQGRWLKSHDLWNSAQRTSWDDVVVDDKMKRELSEDIEGFFNSREPYKSLGVPWKRGIIMHGTPGNGKTLTITALINALYKRPVPVPALYVKTFTSCNGAEYSIRAIFEQARLSAPCLLILEDVDSLVRAEFRSYFLNEVDGLESNDGIMILGSTNNLDKLDPAIAKRPSRFDRKYFFSIPAQAQREQYCQYWRHKLSLTSNTISFPDSLCGAIADITDGFSFAYLKEAFVASLLSIIYDRGAPESETEPEAIAAIAENGDAPKQVADSHPELDDILLWKTMKRQVQTLINEMGSGISDPEAGDGPGALQDKAKALGAERIDPKQSAAQGQDFVRRARAFLPLIVAMGKGDLVEQLGLSLDDVDDDSD